MQYRQMPLVIKHYIIFKNSPIYGEPLPSVPCGLRDLIAPS